jgi:hypothetical protein
VRFPGGSVERLLRLVLAAALLFTVVAAGARAQPASPSVFPEKQKTNPSPEKAKGFQFLPLPLIVTEPAVGYGGGVAVGLIKGGDVAASTGGQTATPTIIGAGGIYTETKTWAAAGAVLLPLFHNRIRYVGVIGYADVHLEFFGFGSRPADNPVRYELIAPLTAHRVQARIGDSDWFAGLSYIFMNSKTSFDGDLPSEITARELDIRLGGLGANLEFDSRDNFLSPRKGVDATGSVTLFGPSFGGQSTFGRAALQGLFYGKPLERWGYGVRVAGGYAWDDVPFFARPYLSMRGLPALKYLDLVSLLGEGELWFQIASRWTALGFGGLGRVARTWSDLSAAENVGAGGVGFRYLLFSNLGLQSGIDVAWGPDGKAALYLQVGTAWR